MSLTIQNADSQPSGPAVENDRKSMSVGAVIRRVWDSPTANTWASLFTRSVSLVLVLPLVLRRFPQPDAATWFVFSTVVAMQGVLGFGFSPSFARLLAYARAGAAPEQMADLRTSRAIADQPTVNWDAVDRLCSCMRPVFIGLAAVSFVAMATLGTVAVGRPVAAIGAGSNRAWLAWAVIVCGSSLSFWTTYYVSLLQGMDRLAEWRRWEILTSLGSIVSAFFTLLFGGGLLGLVVASQVWVIISLFVFRWAAYRVHNGRTLSTVGRRPWERDVFRLVWSSAWKTGLTNVLSQGLVQSTGVIQAQFGTVATTATYNFTLRIMSVLSQVVQAPFITKLPELARLRALGDLSGQVVLIRRGMRITHWSIAAGVTGAALLLPTCLRLLGTRSVAFDPVLWSLFGLTIFLDRHGGMLNQIRNLTNRPLEHVGIAGYFGVNVTLMVVLHGAFGIYTYPAALIGTQLLFSLWFSAYAAYPVITTRPLAFERTVSIPPFVLLVMNSAISIFGISVLK